MVKRAKELRLWIVTPAWKRPEVTDLCLAQRAHLRDELAGAGIRLHCVVVADDENLEVAARHGFDTLERPNEWLGLKVNDGCEYAAAQGADFVAVVDSDSWVHQDLVRAFSWSRDCVHTSNNYAAVSGRKILLFDVRHAFGLGPIWFPRDVLATVAGRPAADDLQRGLSTSMWNRLLDENRELLRWEFRNVHRLQYVGLRSKLQITNVEAIAKRWPVRESAQPVAPVAELRDRYPGWLIDRVEAFYAAFPVGDVYTGPAGPAVRTRWSKFEWAWRNQGGACGDCSRPLARTGRNAQLAEDERGIRLLCARCAREAAPKGASA